MSSTLELLDALSHTDVFQGVENTILEQVCSISELKEVTSGTTIFREGESGTDLFVVVAGAIELTTVIQRGEEQRLALLDKGQIFGELACFDELPRSATACAFVDSIVLSVPGPRLRDLITSSPALAAALLKNLVKKVSLRLRDADQEIRSLTAVKRV